MKLKRDVIQEIAVKSNFITINKKNTIIYFLVAILKSNFHENLFDKITNFFMDIYLTNKNVYYYITNILNVLKRKKFIIFNYI